MPKILYHSGFCDKHNYPWNIVDSLEMFSGPPVFTILLMLANIT